MTGTEVDLAAVTEGVAAAAASGVPHAEALVAFAEGAVGRDDEALARARARVLEELGPEGLVDASAVAANFQRMVRIADATGIPLDAPLEIMTEDLRADLDLARFASSANTPPTMALRRGLGRVLRPLGPRLMKLAVAAQERFGGK